MIVVVDYGMGNLGSIENMLTKIGARVKISSLPADILAAGKLIIPGVGSFDHGVNRLRGLGLMNLLEDRIIGKKIPVLGICLGMQLFGKGSEEGSLPGFGWIDAVAVRFHFEGEMANFKVPHMGWNRIDVRQKGSILDDIYDEPRFYFVHSFHVRCNDPANILATTQYGITFQSAVIRENVIGVQFHPEKSHKYGMKVLQNFVKIS